MKTYDILIIGAGPAGLTAGLYSARNGLKVGIVSKDIGGTANSILRIENWPGYSGSGAKLMKKFYEQVKKYEIDFIIEEVISIDKIEKSKEFIVKTKKQELKSKMLILATGTERKKLKIPGEEEFLGKGVSYCATCDSFFFKNKDVAVIGGSDCATTSALALSDIAKKVYLIYRGEKLKCENINEERLKHKKNVETFYNSFPLEILGKEKVEEVNIMSENKKRNIKIEGIFIEVGSTPLAEFTKNIDLKMDNEKFIEVDENMKTSVEGIYAAGDVTNGKLKQVVISSAQGAIAAKSAYDWLSKKS
ncbi:MAG: FAD-dependent oxidoreductase [Candidatus Pacearchaeota archaeon]|nr:FAD-dependent oxidoreductase [Candidatus Pacearchaeota archaeon]